MLKATKMAGVFFLIMLMATSPVMGQFPIFQNSLVGKKAPDFNLLTLSGKTVKMSDFRQGKDAIIFFWATWCPHCRTQLKQLGEQRAQLEKKGWKIMLVDIGENPAQVEAFMKKQNNTLDVFLDVENKVSDEYQIIGVPTFFIVNKEGVVKAVEHALPSNLDKILKSE